MIEYIEDFGSELQLHLFAERRCLKQRQIPILSPLAGRVVCSLLRACPCNLIEIG
jgi:hypothetical protein